MLDRQLTFNSDVIVGGANSARSEDIVVCGGKPADLLSYLLPAVSHYHHLVCVCVTLSLSLSLSY